MKSLLMKFKERETFHENVMQGVRKSEFTEDMDKIAKVYLDRNGEISAIKNPKISLKSDTPFSNNISAFEIFILQ